MSVYVDPIEATHVLANAAAAVVYAPDAAGRGDALDRLKEAVQHYELCCLVSPVPEYRPASQRHSCDRVLDENCSAGQSGRFKAALTTVGWRVQNPAGLADLLMAIANDVASLHEIPNDDPAVQLVASKVASVCGIAIDEDQVSDLINECFRRSKQRDTRSALTG